MSDSESPTPADDVPHHPLVYGLLQANEKVLQRLLITDTVLKRLQTEDRNEIHVLCPERRMKKISAVLVSLFILTETTNCFGAQERLRVPWDTLGFPETL